MAALRNFTDFALAQSNRVDAAWLNRVDRLTFTATSFAELQSAVTLALGEETIIYLSGTIGVTDNYTVPSNVVLGIAPDGAEVAITLNKTLTILRQPIFPIIPIFTFDPNYTFDSYPIIPAGGGTYAIPVSFGRGCTAYAEWFGALGDATTDDRVAIQAAIDSLWRRGTLQLLGKSYFIGDGYRTTWNNVAAQLWYTNDQQAGGHTGGADDRPAIVIQGMGINTTELVTNQSFGYEQVLALYANGEGITIRDFSVNIVRDSGSPVGTCLYTTGNGGTVERVYTGGGLVGIRQHAGIGWNFLNCWSEFCTVTYWCDEAAGTRFTQCQAYSPDTAGFKLTATAAGIAGGLPNDGTMWDAVQIDNCTASNLPATATGLLVNVHHESLLPVQSSNSYYGTNGFTTSVFTGGAMVGLYGALIEAAYDFKSTGDTFGHTKAGGVLVNSSTAAKFVAPSFVRIGMYNQTTATVQCPAIQCDPGSNVEIVSPTFLDCAGAAISSQAARLLVVGGRYINCCNGGLDANNDPVNLANPVLGDKVIYLEPTATTDRIKLMATDHYSQAAYNAGRTGIYMDCSTAVPAPGNVEFISNKAELGSYDTLFDSTGVTVVERNNWLSTADDFLPTTPVVLPSWANADAPNNRFFYETGAGKPGWKDGTGTFNPFY